MSSSEAPHWWTLANVLTAGRFVLAPAFAFALLGRNDGAALLLFVVAVSTDVLDGWAARRRGNASAGGALFDHATDAWFVCLAMGALAARGMVPVALPLVVVAAFVQYALDSRALQGQQLRASWLGRCNGIAYYALVGTPTVRDGLSIGWPSDSTVTYIAFALLLSTIASIADRATASLRSNGQ